MVGPPPGRWGTLSIVAVVSRPTSGAKTTAGQTIGKYSIVRELGARRPSMVLATGVAPSGAIDFAILELVGEGDLDPQATAAFVLRARRLAQIRHPNVGRIRDVMVQKDRVAIVTVSIDDLAETARAHLEKNGWLATINRWAGEGGWHSPAAQAFRVRGVPTAYVLDRDGKVVQAGHPLSLDFAALIEAQLATRAARQE